MNILSNDSLFAAVIASMNDFKNLPLLTFFQAEEF